MRQIPALYSFNRGLCSVLALARTDQKRVSLAAETMNNFIAKVLGPMVFRPGLGYIGASYLNLAVRYLKFIFATSDTSLVEITNQTMRIWIDDVLLTRPAVSTAISNGGFSQYTTTATISHAAPAIVTYSGADVFANNDPVAFYTDGALPAPLAQWTNYYVKNLNAGANTFEIAATAGGTSIDTTTDGSGTHTALATNFVTGWTDGSDSGGLRAWGTGDRLKLTSNGTARAIAYQLVTVAAADQGIEHALRIVINTGPVTLRVGSTLGGEEYVTETDLEQGYHSIAFTPTGNFYVQFSSTTVYKKLITSCTMESAGVVTITSPWLTADLDYLRYDQSGDVLYVACDGYQQRTIQRRGTRPGARSWSVAIYQTEDGPFRLENVGPITIAASATTGDITLTASQPLFRSTHVGALFSITSSGQTQTKTIAAQNTFSSSIRVTGVGASRSFGITITGSLGGVTKVTLQSSLDDSTFNDVAGEQWTATTSTSYADGLDNQVIYYRIGIKTGDYAGPDSAVCTLIFNAGSQTGIVRVLTYTSSTQVDAQVLKDLGATTATDIWAEGHWSSYRGFPTAVRIHEGRLIWSGRNGIWASVSDAYTSFDAETVGDSGPINRTIGSGPVDGINFLLSLQRLIIGAEGKEVSVRSSSLDTPLTPTDFTMKDASTQGSAKVEAWKVDQRGVYVQRGTIKVYEVVFDVQSYDYTSNELTALVPELGSPGIIRLDVQRQPDTRIHCVRSDGVVMLGTYDKTEDVLAWQTVSVENGYIEDVVILPSEAGSTEDQVYYVVRLTVALLTKRYLVKWAKETECRAGTLNKNADCFVTFSNSPATTTVVGLDHLVGKSVVVWQDGAPALDTNGDVKSFTVSTAGAITLDSAATTGVVGLSYTGTWQSAKLGLQVSPLQTPLNQQKRISHLGLILAYFYPGALQYGPDFSNLDDMPGIERGKAITGAQTSYDEQEFPFPGTWTTDLRLCLQAQAPLPVTVLACAADLEVHD